jgi:hypothetical protein
MILLLPRFRKPMTVSRLIVKQGKLRPISNVFRRLRCLDVGHGILLLEQIPFNITTASFLQLSHGEAGYLSLQPKQFRLLSEIGLSIMDTRRANDLLDPVI